MREALDVFLQRDDVLQVRVLPVAVDGVVDYYAVVERVAVCGDDDFLHRVFLYVLPGVLEVVLTAGSLGPVGVDFCGGVGVCQDAEEMWFSLEVVESGLDFRKERLCDSVG